MCAKPNHPHRSANLRHGATETSPHDTCAKLIQAATSLLARKGFDGVSVKELAEAAGVNVSLISYHFGGKEGLYRACLEQFGKARLDSSRRTLQPPQSFEEFIVRLKLFAEDLLLTHAEKWELCQILHRECDMEVTIAHDIFRDTFLEAFRMLVVFFETAQKKQILKADLNPTTTAALFFGGLLHMGRLDRLNEEFFGNSIKDPAYRSHVVEHAVRSYVNGVINDTRGHS